MAKAKSAAKKGAAKKGAVKKKGAFDRFVEHIETAPATKVGKAVPATDAKLAAIIALAKKHDARVHAYLDTLVRKNTSFCVFDVEAYPDQLLRGKRNEPWNEGARVVTASDVCLARNGAGDIYVWNAEDGSVRFLVHDEGWRESQRFKNVDAFIESLLDKVIQLIDPDGLEEVDEGYLGRLRFALEIAGDDGLDDEAREKLEELGVV
ncbi:MAG: hypothetical protein ACXVEF_04920 [Polyangiales bacterium]